MLRGRYKSESTDGGGDRACWFLFVKGRQYLAICFHDICILNKKKRKNGTMGQWRKAKGEKGAERIEG